jgi:hypothetical protein
MVSATRWDPQVASSRVLGERSGGIVTAVPLHVKSGKAIGTEHHLRVVVRGRT